MTKNIQLYAKFSMKVGYSPFKLRKIYVKVHSLETIFEIAKEKMNYGLQNVKEIVRVLHRSQNKMEIINVFFSSQVDSLFSLLKSTIIFQVLCFSLQHCFFRNIQHHINMENTIHSLHPTPRIRQAFYSLRAAAYLMVRKKKTGER